MTNTRKTDQQDNPPEESPLETNKPIGDAIPTPTEPGLDQPLPEKDAIPPQKRSPKDEAKDEPIGETDTPPGVPPPGPSDFA
ncbi:hypothetical protein [Paraburkholderia phosphatilytica]|uniref:hypothetical protein n=1 Tax=Paraburkholderia phosphatilytica TaxID=2282883 RepID=UPI000E557293|nr:hypothetical protein [Paraburkholderia phosphatilytica]